MTSKENANSLDVVVVKKRGRPSTGNALSSASRKAAQRKRDYDAVWNLGMKKLKDVSSTGLIEQLSFAISIQDYDIAKQITTELLLRIKPLRK